MRGRSSVGADTAARRARRRSEERTRLAFEAAGLFTWEVIPGEGRMEWSENAAAVLRCDPAVLRAEANRSSFFVAPDERHAVEATFARAFAERAETFEVEYRGACGSRRWRSSGRVFYDARGEVARVVGATQDVTARHEAEERFRALANGIPQLAWMARADGYIFWFNDRWYEYTGTTPASQEGSGWESVHDPAELPRVRERWQAALASGDAWEDTFPLRRHDGAYRWHLSRARPLRDADGAITLWFGTNTDVEDERRARAEVERLGRMKDEFLATLSHELRTPLSAILGWTQLLRRNREPRPEALAEGLAVIERNARTQAQLIEDLLDTSRIVSGKVRLEPHRVDFAEVAAAAIDVVRPAMIARGLRLDADLSAGPAPVLGDPARLQQVCWNLLANAVKFTPSGGSVRVALRRGAGVVELQIDDTGQGIAPDFLPYIFERFRQADGSTTRKHGGLGLGLAIVKHLVELHGGSVRVSSAGVGRGATFITSLPLAEASLPASPDGAPAAFAEANATLHPPVEPDGAQGLEGVRVLVVEDDGDVRAITARVLRDAGARVTSCAGASTALACLRADPPELLVSDIGMPDMDGYELLRRVRALPAEEGGAVPAVALTAYARSDDRALALAAGFTAHVSKPFAPAALVALCRAALTGAAR